MGSAFFNGTGLGWGGSLCSMVNYSRTYVRTVSVAVCVSVSVYVCQCVSVALCKVLPPLSRYYQFIIALFSRNLPVIM